MKRKDAARLLRRRPTEAGARLWSALRRNQLDGLHFRREEPIGSFFADFYCRTARLAVEVDGGVHDADAQVEYDRDRDAAIASLAIRVLRVSNDDVLRNLPEVLGRIREACRTSDTPRTG